MYYRTEIGSNDPRTVFNHEYAMVYYLVEQYLGVSKSQLKRWSSKGKKIVGTKDVYVVLPKQTGYYGRDFYPLGQLIDFLELTRSERLRQRFNMIVPRIIDDIILKRSDDDYMPWCREAKLVAKEGRNCHAS